MAMGPENVLIAGAGPTGLVAAIALVKQGVTVRIIDKADTPASTSRALVMHARTLELYQLLDLTDDTLAAGHKLRALNIWSYGSHKARIPLDRLGRGLTRYPFIFVIPQDIHERVLEQKARSLGISVERQTQLLDFMDHGSHITARIQRVDGSEELFDAAYVLGCDGAHSAVRHAMEVDFQGDAYKKLFCLADIEGSGTSVNGEMHVHAMGDDFMLAIAYNDCSRVRVIGTVSNDGSKELTFDDMRPHIERDMGLTVGEVNWFTTYRVHHRVAQRFRRGRAFLVGDAAHIHSPVGGQGMNTGIGDAINLAWKVAAVLHGKANDSLLDTYEIERRAFATRLVASTDRAFNMVTSTGFVANIFRQFMFTFIAPTALRFQLIGDFFFRMVSQVQLNYRHSPLAARTPESRLQAGDRLPFIPVEQGDNYRCITQAKWQAHVYGAANSGLTDWCQCKNIDLQQFDWNEGFQKVGLMRDAVYLLRPDSYIAAVIGGNDVEVLNQYLLQQHIEL